MFSVAPPKRRFCRFLYYPWFLRSTPPPTLERAVGQKRTATQSVVITYLIKKLNEKRKKNSPKYRSQHVVLPDDCQTALPAYSARSDLLCVVSPVFFASSFLTATAECLCYSPKGQNRERKSPFHIRTGDMLSTSDNSPNYGWRVRCWLVEARPKKRELCTLSLATTAEKLGPKPDEWEYSWHLVPRRTSLSSSSAYLVRAFPSVAVPFATCVSRKCEIVEQRGGGKEGGRKEGSFIIAAAGDGGDGDGRQYTLGKLPSFRRF